MTNMITISLRVFPVLACDNRTGKEETITVPVTKEQLQAAQIVGQSSKELIERLCNRQGYAVLDIGRPDRLPITLDLEVLAEMYQPDGPDQASGGDTD